MEDEYTGDEGQASDETIETTLPPTEIEIDGVMMSVDDIKNLQGKEKEYARGFTKKSQELVAEKEQFLNEKQVFQAKAEALANAKDADVHFYTSNDPDKWPGYNSQIDAVLGRGQGQAKQQTAQASIPPEILSEVQSFRKELNTFKSTSQAEKTTSTLQNMEKIVKTEYPFASPEDLRDKIYVFYKTETRLPSTKEVRGMAKKQHDRVANLAVVRGQSKGSGGRIPSSKNSGSPKPLPKEIPRLSDLQTNTDAMKTYFDNKALARGQER